MSKIDMLDPNIFDDTTTEDIKYRKVYVQNEDKDNNIDMKMWMSQSGKGAPSCECLCSYGSTAIVLKSTPAYQSWKYKTRKDNKTGHAGVFWNKSRQKYQVTITAKHKTYYMGSFKHLFPAILTRVQAEHKYWTQKETKK